MVQAARLVADEEDNGLPAAPDTYSLHSIEVGCASTTSTKGLICPACSVDLAGFGLTGFTSLGATAGCALVVTLCGSTLGFAGSVAAGRHRNWCLISRHNSSRLRYNHLTCRIVARHYGWGNLIHRPLLVSRLIDHNALSGVAMPALAE